MRSAAPLTFGARLARHRIAPEETAWFFNVPDEAYGEPAPASALAPTDPDDRVQIGPLDV